MRLTVKYLDGRTETLNAGPRAQVELERKYNISFGEISRNEHFYFLGWAALRFSGKESREFDEFLEAIEDVSPDIAVTAEEKAAAANPPELDPTEAGSSAAS